MDLYTELTGLLDALNQEAIDYAICGGIAVALHGYVRFTKDIDLLIRPEDLNRTLEIATTCGFQFAAPAMTFATGTPNELIVHRVGKIAGSEFLSLDLVLATPVLEDVLPNQVRFALQGRVVRVVARAGLAKMKRLAGRDQDLLDLKMLGMADE